MKLLTNKKDYLYPTWWERAKRFSPQYRDYYMEDNTRGIFTPYKTFAEAYKFEAMDLCDEDFAILEEDEEALSPAECRMMMAQEELKLKHYEFTRENGLKGNLIIEEDNKTITILLENDTDRLGYISDIQYNPNSDTDSWELRIPSCPSTKEEVNEYIQIEEGDLSHFLDELEDARVKEKALEAKIKAEKDELIKKATAIVVANPLMLDWTIAKVKRELDLDISGLKEIAEKGLWNPFAFYIKGLSCLDYCEVKEAIEFARELFAKEKASGLDDDYIICEHYLRVMSDEYIKETYGNKQ